MTACGDNTSFRGGIFICQNYYHTLYSVAYFHYFVGNIKSRHPVAGRLLKYIAGYNAMRAGRKDVTYNEIHNLIIDL